MKQLLFLLLFPCLALAQYPSNENQKISLGEQTTADGLVWRGRLADTANLLTNKLDTSVYIVLDTGTRAMWYYRASTTPKWTRLVDSLNNLQGQLSLTTKVTGVLPVANGGTNTSTAFTQGSVVFAGASGTYTQDNANLFWDDSNNRLGIKKSDPIFNLDINGTIRISHTTANAYSAIFYNQDINGEGLTIRGGSASNHNSLLVQTYNGGTELFSIAGNGAAKFSTLVGSGSRGVNAAADGTISAASSITIKENVSNLNYGLDKIMQLQPKSFNYIDKNKYGEGLDIGFIAEDVYTIVPEATGTMNDGFIYFDAVRLIPILTKAMQEQQTLIKALEQRILILENK